MLSIIGLFIIIKFGVQFHLDYQNQNYASDRFKNIPFHAVLESRKWHTEIFGCTYAIVVLRNDAPIIPPKQWFPTDEWHKTPLIFNKEIGSSGCHNLICECEENWNPENYRRLTRALNQPGSFYVLQGGENPPHDRVYQGSISVYSKTQGVAAMVRYGD